MNTRKKKTLKALAVFFAFALTQVYGRPGVKNQPAQQTSPPKPIIGRLTTTGNEPIQINGNSVGTGGSILTGATIETPDGVSAMIDLGDAGGIEVQPGSKIQLDWNANGNVRVKLIEGCAEAKKETKVLPGEIEFYSYTTCDATDQNRREICSCIAPDGGLSPCSKSLTIAKIGGIVGGITGPTVLVVVLTRGENPSPTR